MAWGRKKTAAQTPAWSQDDYHAEFAGKLKEQIEQGRGAVAEAVEARRAALAGKRCQQEAVPGRQFRLLERGPNREGLQRSPLGHLQTDQGHGRSGPQGREGHPRALLQV